VEDKSAEKVAEPFSNNEANDQKVITENMSEEKKQAVLNQVTFDW
jgi:hypothetical protein